MLTCKITLPDSPHPVIISKNPGFRPLYLARLQNEFRFRLINTKKYFFIWFLPEKFSFCPINNGFSPVWAGGSPQAPQPPSSSAPLARTPILKTQSLTRVWSIYRFCWVGSGCLRILRSDVLWVGLGGGPINLTHGPSRPQSNSGVGLLILVFLTYRDRLTIK